MALEVASAQLEGRLGQAVSTTNSHSAWFKDSFTETRKFTAPNQVRKSHEVLRQTGFETTLPGQRRRPQSGAQSKKPRVVRGLRLPQGLLSRFEVFVLEGQTTLHHKLPKFLIGTPIKHLGFNSSS